MKLETLKELIQLEFDAATNIYKLKEDVFTLLDLYHLDNNKDEEIKPSLFNKLFKIKK